MKLNYGQGAMSYEHHHYEHHHHMQGGGYMIYHIDDIRKVAPLWLEYTKKVRSPMGEKWWFKLGDSYVTKGNCQVPFIFIVNYIY